MISRLRLDSHDSGRCSGRSALSRAPAALLRSGRLSSSFTPGGFRAGTSRIRSGDASVGGTKAHITSEFAVAMQLGIFTTLFYAFFISVAAGMTIIQDEEWRLGELLHATPLRTREYIWAKFAAVLAGCLIILGIHLAATAFFYHVLPNAEAAGVPRAVPARELLEAGARLLGTDDRLPGGRFVCGRRVDAAAGAGVSAAGGDRGSRRVLPLGVVAELARPADRLRAHADRLGGLSLAQRDVAQGRPGGEFL